MYRHAGMYSLAYPVNIVRFIFTVADGHSYTNTSTVKPVLKDHPISHKNLVSFMTCGLW